MNWAQLVMVALGGGSGAVLRWLVDGWIKQRTELPLALLLINVSGSLCLGFVSSLLASQSLLLALLGVGLLGGFTTFSSASVESAQLAEQRRWRAAISVPTAMLGLSVASVLIGRWLATCL